MSCIVLKDPSTLRLLDLSVCLDALALLRVPLFFTLVNPPVKDDASLLSVLFLLRCFRTSMDVTEADLVSFSTELALREGFDDEACWSYSSRLFKY